MACFNTRTFAPAKWQAFYFGGPVSPVGGGAFAFGGGVIARKSKLTRALIRKAERLLSQGNYVEAICSALGISEQTWYRWLREGEQEERGLKCEFCEAVTRATSQAELEAVEAWTSAFGDDWRAAKEFLARRYRDRWGPPKPQETEAPEQEAPGATRTWTKPGGDG